MARRASHQWTRMVQNSKRTTHATARYQSTQYQKIALVDIVPHGALTHQTSFFRRSLKPNTTETGANRNPHNVRALNLQTIRYSSIKQEQHGPGRPKSASLLAVVKINPQQPQPFLLHHPSALLTIVADL